MAICHTRDNSHESLEYGDLSYERLEYIHLSCKCLGKRSIYHPSNCFGNNLPRSLLAHENSTQLSFWIIIFLALMVAARNKIPCFFWYLDFCIFFTMHHLLLAWTLPFAEICWTVDHRPPFPVFLLHRRPKQPTFLEQAQAPAWIVRWGWMARETARLENLPQTSGNFRLARWEDSALTILSVASVAT